ncbi:MAG: alpha/beta hydrolase [Opitutaceae bacterium]|nr:alpha/beta hydrolase [Opitutaceae bacterium]
MSERAEVFRVAHGKSGEAELRMHLYLPAGEVRTPRPAVVFFFGGGWTGGTAEHFAPQARHLASLGMVTACADYRVASRHGTTPFDAVRDAKEAIRWMRANATRLGVDPDKIVAAGGSAGGHLAACTAMIAGFEDAVPVEGGERQAISSAPNALVLFNPVLDTTGKGFGRDKVTPARETEISPCHHVHAGLPPTLVMHGEADTVAPFENAERFARDMRAAGNRVHLVAYPKKQHGFFNRRENADGVVDDADFLATLRETEMFLRDLGYL